jgi:hypothetical protein
MGAVVRHPAAMPSPSKLHTSRNTRAAALGGDKHSSNSTYADRCTSNAKSTYSSPGDGVMEG